MTRQLLTTDLRTPFQSGLGNTYTLEREPGGGGISRVFVAEETALGRKVNGGTELKRLPRTRARP